VEHQEGQGLLLTGDLGAREVAKEVGLERHGSFALVTLAYCYGILSQGQAFDCIERLHAHSGLCLTSDLIAWANARFAARRS